MNEEQLKKYWSAYTDAWRLLKNHEHVTEQHIGQMIKKYSDTVFNRLFCLVVWQEIKRIRAKDIVFEATQYCKAFDTVWHLFKDYSEPDDSEKYWEKLVCKMQQIGDDFKQSRFIRDLLTFVTLEEIERLWREQKRGEDI